MNSIVSPGASVGALPPSTQPKSTLAGDTGSAAGQVSAPATRDDDSVQLTESARAIEVAASSTEVPVDAQRVAQIRQQIADGSYQMDAQRVAASLISLEKQLG